jgi:Tfp pilus assembly protein PilP
MSVIEPKNEGHIYWKYINNKLLLSSMPAKDIDDDNNWINYTNLDEAVKKIVEHLLSQPNSNQNTTTTNVTNKKPVGIFWKKIANETFVAINPTELAQNNWINLYSSDFKIIATELLAQYNEVNKSSVTSNSNGTVDSIGSSKSIGTGDPTITSINEDTTKLAELITKILDGLSSSNPK